VGLAHRLPPHAAGTACGPELTRSLHDVFEAYYEQGSKGTSLLALKASLLGRGYSATKMARVGSREWGQAGVCGLWSLKLRRL